MKSHSTNLGILVFLLSCGFAQPCFALMGGNEVGNGGNAIVCPASTQLLDIYEAKLLRGVKLDPSLKNGDPFFVALGRISILSEIDPKTAKIVRKSLEKLKTQISFETAISIRPIDDSKHSFAPSDPKCRVQQLAVFRKKVLPGEKTVLVDKTIWNKLPPVHQAGLLLHEAIYQYLSQLGESDSTKARYLVTFLLSDAFGAGKSEEYWAVIKKLRVPIYR